MNRLTYKKWFSKEREEVRSITFKRDGDKEFILSFEGNLDLYFTLRNFGTDSSFLIGKDNYEIWQVFDKLYNDIINAQVFDTDKTINLELEDEVIRTKENKTQELNSNLKSSYEYKNLVTDNIITWKSDDFPHDAAPYFKIEKLENSYLITFGVPEITRDLDLEEEFMLKDYKYLKTISVRIRNSGSSYAPFNIPFMTTFNYLMEELDEPYEQIHIEEYLINKEIKEGHSLEKILRKK